MSPVNTKTDQRMLRALHLFDSLNFIRSQKILEETCQTFQRQTLQKN